MKKLIKKKKANWGIGMPEDEGLGMPVGSAIELNGVSAFDPNQKDFSYFGKGSSRDTTTKASPTKDILGTASRVFSDAGNFVGGMFASLPALSSLIPDNRTNPIAPLPRAVPPKQGNQYNTQMLFDDGGNFNNKVDDPTYSAMAKVISQRNRNNNWVERGLNPQNYPFLMEGDQKVTHKLSYGNDDNGYYVFPNVIQNDDGKLQDLDPDEAHGWAKESGTEVRMPSRKIAEYYSQNGLIKHYGGGGNIDGYQDDGNGFKTKSWNSGNMEVSQTMPSWYNENVRTPIPLADISPTPISPYKINESSSQIPYINYERLQNAGNNHPMFYPKFIGDWSQQDRKQTLRELPEMHSQNGVSGELLKDFNFEGYTPEYQWQTPTPYTPRPSLEELQYNNGGSLSVGQEVELTPAQVKYYKSLGYEFE